MTLSVHVIENFGDLGRLCHNSLALVEVEPVGAIYVPAAHPVDHVAIQCVVDTIFFLLVDHIFGQLDLVSVALSLIAYVHESTRNLCRLCLQISLLDNLSLFVSLGTHQCILLLLLGDEPSLVLV